MNFGVLIYKAKREPFFRTNHSLGEALAENLHVKRFRILSRGQRVKTIGQIRRVGIRANRREVAPL